MENTPFEVKWYIENKVALFLQYQEATLDNVDNMIQATNQLIQSSPQNKVAVIVNISGMKGNQSSISAIARHFQQTRSAKWGFTVIIGAENMVVKFLGQIFFQLGRIEVRFADDIDDAMAILYRIDPDLPSSLGA